MGALRALAELAAAFDSANVLVLCYHQIRSREHFHTQMTVLKEVGYGVVSMERFIERLDKPVPPQRAVVLTFDGCSRDQLENALPVLDSFKFPATFFPVSGFLDSDFSDQPVPWRQALCELVQAGHTIGCHSHSHPELTKLSVTQLHREVVTSKRILEEAIGVRVKAFCYPYGDWNARIASAVREAGYDVAFTVDLGGVNPGDNPYGLKRVPVLGEPGPAEFRTYLLGKILLSGIILVRWKIQERLLESRDA